MGLHETTVGNYTNWFAHPSRLFGDPMARSQRVERQAVLSIRFRLSWPTAIDGCRVGFASRPKTLRIARMSTRCSRHIEEKTP